MTILYIFPHPDDESFGPAGAMARQRSEGHAVHLLTLTRGGATKRRFELGLSVDEMGEVRYREMLDVARALDLSGMTVLDLPDSGLKEMDPREIERVIIDEIERLRPEVIVSYPVHGISGFHDHLIAHAVVKRLFVEMRSNGASYLKRLAFCTLHRENPKLKGAMFPLQGSTDEEIDCAIPLRPEDIDAQRRALDCYVTYRKVIEEARVLEILGETTYFEIFQERHDPPLDDLFTGLDA